MIGNLGQAETQPADSAQLAINWQPYPEIPGWAEAGIRGSLVVSEIASPQLRNRRPVAVYMPGTYDGQRRYPVLYMQDGQNLFDPSVGFGGQTWQVASTLTQLASEGIEAIVVAPYHGVDARIREYNPFPSWRHGCGEDYVRFMTDTLKPIIDRDFHTLASPAHTVVLGSSMGGLISLYAYLTRPDVFGAGGAMSPSLWVANGAIYDVVRKLGQPTGRLYVDNGTREMTAEPLAELLQQQGYELGRNLLYVSARGHRHTESAWAQRLPNALRFLLGAANRD